MIRRPPRSTPTLSSAASDVYKRQDLISALHTFCAQNNNMFKNILPPLSLLNKNDEEELMNRLKDLKFYNKPTLAA